MLKVFLSARREWFLLSSAGRVSPRRATYFSLLRQRKVSKRKATRSLGPYASLRATCGARAKRGLAKLAFGSDNASPDPLVSALLGPARTGQSGTEYQKTKKTNTNKDTPWRVLVVFGIRLFGIPVPTPLCMRRGAEVQADKGSRCLSEAQRSEFSETPPEPSTAGCPGAKRRGRRHQGRLFFCLLFFWRSKRKVSSCRATPGQPPSAE